MGVFWNSEAEILTKNKDLAKTALNFVPYSIRIGDNQYSFGRLDPFGAIIGIVADYNRYYDRLTEAELAQVGNGMNMMLWSTTGENTLPVSSKISNFASASVIMFNCAKESQFS